jgi:T5orf172 domain
MSKPIEHLLPEKPEARLRIYAYSIEDEAHAGWLKIGQTTQDVKTRVQQQTKTAAIKNHTIHIDESAERDDGSVFSDHQVRARLKAKGFENPALEWMKCSVADVKSAIAELRVGQEFTGTHHETFAMRPEQTVAVSKTHAYFHSIWKEDMHAVPRFLWNAKMRFGKTFAAYQLAKRLGATKVLVVTFKPAVEDAWQHDLDSHADFDGWQYLSKATGGDPTTADKKRPLVYFGSFQDLLGKDKSGNIKAKNTWLHTTNWDLVVFDEYHFGAWRDNAKELFEGEDDAEAKKEMKAEFNPGLAGFNEELDELGENEAEFLPSATKAYL